jgi:putative FmdB family regulatory protein
MPIYEFVCEKCRREFDLLRPMSQADDPAACETCGSLHTKRKLSLFAAHSGGKAIAALISPFLISPQNIRLFINNYDLLTPITISAIISFRPLP